MSENAYEIPNEFVEKLKIIVFGKLGDAKISDILMLVEELVKNKYYEGHEDGHSRGYEEGNEVGYDDGRQDGYQEGYDSAKSDVDMED